MSAGRFIHPLTHGRLAQTSPGSRRSSSSPPHGRFSRGGIRGVTHSLPARVAQLNRLLASLTWLLKRGGWANALMRIREDLPQTPDSAMSLQRRRSDRAESVAPSQQALGSVQSPPVVEYFQDRPVPDLAGFRHHQKVRRSRLRQSSWQSGARRRPTRSLRPSILKPPAHEDGTEPEPDRPPRRNLSRVPGGRAHAVTPSHYRLAL
ncbi:hypothetical protein BH20ACT14_BH20ACT14_08990 [soil metagenome]